MTGSLQSLPDPYGPPTNLWDLIERRAKETPDKQVGVDEEGRSITARELRDGSERAAAGLAALGVGEGAAVSWMLPTWFESAMLVAALARLGAVQNPMLPILGPREMEFISGQTGASLFVVPSTWKGRNFEAEARAIADSRSGMEVLVSDRTLPDGDPTTLPPPPAPTTPEDAPVRWVFYTSGTTADPKGAQHTDHNVLASAIGMIDALEIEPDDRSAMVFPFTHIGGIGWLFTMAITGCVGIFVEAFDPKGTVEVLRREDVTLAGAGTPFHMAYLAAQRAEGKEPIFPHVRCCPGGGAPKPPQLHYDCKAELGGVGVVSGYGLTEAPILTMCTVHDTDQQLADTEGAACPAVQLRAVTLEGKVAGPGEEGEIRAKGRQIFKGYLDSSLDAAAFDEDGWFRSGDLGVIEADGHVRITGRLKDIIVRKGENISAKEIEDLLFAHPQIADAAVIGLADDERGEMACAVVVIAEGEATPQLSDLFEYLKDKGLSVQKIPERLEVVDVLPRNPAGKVLKHELRSTYS